MRLLLFSLLVCPAWVAPQDSASAPSAVAIYSRYLAALDKDSLDAISVAVGQFRALFAGQPPALGDSACLAFLTYFHATISRLNDRVWEDFDFIAQLHAAPTQQGPKVARFLAALERNGLALYSFGRLLYIDQQPDYVYGQFGPLVSEAVSRYLALRRGELISGFSDSDSLLIPYRTLGERIVRWERYMARYPNSVMAGRAAYYYRLYLSTFVTGLADSPVFDAAGALDPRLSTVYHEFASRHLLTRSGAIVREFYTLLRAADFRWSPPVRDFYEAHGITNMHRAQVPYR